MNIREIPTYKNKQGKRFYFSGTTKVKKKGKNVLNFPVTGGRFGQKYATYTRWKKQWK